MYTPNGLVLPVWGSGGWGEEEDLKAEAEKLGLIRPMYWQAEAFDYAMMQMEVIGRGCVEAKDETSDAQSREDVQGTRYLDGSSDMLCARLEWGMVSGRWAARQRRGWFGRRETIRWYGMEEELRKGIELSTIVSGSGEVGGQRRRRSLDLPERVTDGNCRCEKSGETAEG